MFVAIQLDALMTFHILVVCSHGASPSLYQAQESSPYSVSTNSSSYSVPFTAGRTSPYAPSPYAPSPNSLLVSEERNALVLKIFM